MIPRRADCSDAGALSDLHRRTFARPWSAADFEVWLRREEVFCAVLESGDRLTALGLVLAAGADAELLTIATAPEERGRGRARKVLEWLDQEAQRRGLERWVLEVSSDNQPARRLYERLEFIEIGLRKGYYSVGTDRFDGIVLARPVGGLLLAPGGQERN